MKIFYKKFNIMSIKLRKLTVNYKYLPKYAKIFAPTY